MTDTNSRMLIVDVGMNIGQDTDFYLAKGFSVLAIEADPDISRACAKRFAADIETGRLTIISKAVGESGGSATLFRNKSLSEWSTMDPKFAERNSSRMGAPSTKIQVETATLAEMLAHYPTPHYIKIDIEGMDYLALEQLSASKIRPTFLSIEASKKIDGFRAEINLMESMGYSAFKLVQQQHVQKQTPPFPAREGKYVDFKFPFGASGLFGEEAPGEWLSSSTLISRYKTIALMERLVGDWPLIPVRPVRGAIKRLFFDPGWHDLHGRLGVAV